MGSQQPDLNGTSFQSVASNSGECGIIFLFLARLPTASHFLHFASEGGDICTTVAGTESYEDEISPGVEKFNPEGFLHLGTGRLETLWVCEQVTVEICLVSTKFALVIIYPI
jgi:hypothetical protein